MNHHGDAQSSSHSSPNDAGELSKIVCEREPGIIKDEMFCYWKLAAHSLQSGQMCVGECDHTDVHLLWHLTSYSKCIVVHFPYIWNFK